MDSVKDPQLEREGRHLSSNGMRALVLGALAAVPGVALLVIGLSVSIHIMWLIGIVVLVLAGGPAVIGIGMFLAGVVARWSARHKSFA